MGGAPRVKVFEAGGQDEGTHRQLQEGIGHIVVNGAALAGREAFQALRAHAAAQAALGLGQGFFFGHGQVNFGEVVLTGFRRGGQDFGARPVRDDALGNAGLDFLFGNVGDGHFGRLGHAVCAAQVAVHAARHVVTFANGIHHEEGGAAAHIAGGENARHGGHHIFIRLQAGPILLLDAAIRGQEGEIGLLADRPDDHVAGDHVVGAGDLLHLAFAIHDLADFGLQAADADDLVVLDHYLFKDPAADDLNPLGDSLFQLVEGGAHAAANDAHAGLAQAHGGAGGIQGHVASAQHDDAAPAQVNRLAQAGAAQQVQAEPVIGVVSAGDAELGGHVGAGGDDDGIVASQEEGVDAFHAGVQAQLDALINHLLHLPIHAVIGQAVRRDANAHHAAGYRQGIEGGGGVAQAHQVQAGGQASRAGADDGDLFAAGGGLVGKGGANQRLIPHIGQLVAMGVGPIGNKAFQAHDADRLIVLRAAALLFTALVAHPPADRGEGMLAADGPIGICVTLLADQGNVALGALVGGAGGPAGSDAVLGDGIGTGHRLGRIAVDGFALAQALVKGVDHLHRADLGAFAAAGAGGFVHKAGLAADADLVVSNVARNGFHLAAGQQLDVGVASHGRHFGGENSSRTVERWKGLVQLGHVPADAGLALHQVNLLAGVGQAQGRLNPGDAAAKHQGRLLHLNVANIERAVVTGTPHRGADHAARFGGGLLGVVHHPRAVLADVGHLEEEGIQVAFGAGLPEGRLVHQRGAGSHHHPVQALFVNILLDQGLAGV